VYFWGTFRVLLGNFPCTFEVLSMYFWGTFYVLLRCLPCTFDVLSMYFWHRVLRGRYYNRRKGRRRKVLRLYGRLRDIPYKYSTRQRTNCQLSTAHFLGKAGVYSCVFVMNACGFIVYLLCIYRDLFMICLWSLAPCCFALLYKKIESEAKFISNN